MDCEVAVAPGDEVDLTSPLLPCAYCNRKFRRIADHIQICQKLSQKKRKTFDSSKQRLSGIPEKDKTLIKPVKPQPLRSLQPSSAGSGEGGRRCSLPATSGVHRDRQRQGEAKRRVSDNNAGPRRRPRSERSELSAVQDSYVQCPACDRWFGPKAADRHIEWCTTRVTKLAFCSSQPSPQERERWRNRSQYKVPLPSKGRLEVKAKYQNGKAVPPRVARGFSPPKEHKEPDPPPFNYLSTPLSPTAPARNSLRRSSMKGRRFGEASVPVQPPRRKNRSPLSLAKRAEPDGIDHLDLPSSKNGGCIPEEDEEEDDVEEAEDDDDLQGEADDEAEETEGMGRTWTNPPVFKGRTVIVDEDDEEEKDFGDVLEQAMLSRTGTRMSSATGVSSSTGLSSTIDKFRRSLSADDDYLSRVAAEVEEHLKSEERQRRLKRSGRSRTFDDEGLVVEHPEGGSTATALEGRRPSADMLRQKDDQEEPGSAKGKMADGRLNSVDRKKEEPPAVENRSAEEEIEKSAPVSYGILVNRERESEVSNKPRDPRRKSRPDPSVTESDVRQHRRGVPPRKERSFYRWRRLRFWLFFRLSQLLLSHLLLGHAFSFSLGSNPGFFLPAAHSDKKFPLKSYLRRNQRVGPAPPAPPSRSEQLLNTHRKIDHRPTVRKHSCVHHNGSDGVPSTEAETAPPPLRTQRLKVKPPHPPKAVRQPVINSPASSMSSASSGIASRSSEQSSTQTQTPPSVESGSAAGGTRRVRVRSAHLSDEEGERSRRPVRSVGVQVSASSGAPAEEARTPPRRRMKGTSKIFPSKSLPNLTWIGLVLGDMLREHLSTKYDIYASAARQMEELMLMDSGMFENNNLKPGKSESSLFSLKKETPSAPHSSPASPEEPVTPMEGIDPGTAEEAGTPQEGETGAPSIAVPDAMVPYLFGGGGSLPGTTRRRRNRSSRPDKENQSLVERLFDSDLPSLEVLRSAALRIQGDEDERFLDLLIHWNEQLGYLHEEEAFQELGKLSKSSRPDKENQSLVERLFDSDLPSLEVLRSAALRIQGDEDDEDLMAMSQSMLESIASEMGNLAEEFGSTRPRPTGKSRPGPPPAGNGGSGSDISSPTGDSASSTGFCYECGNQFPANLAQAKFCCFCGARKAC
ncbi:unnamed protein product [Cyprideis torosa]|uniref:C2HC/C3H-type domain-containing protein n=1 Tax=Cyprideis torosa TaxID=163714 RepID=A0A7R8WA23_9CRUS|nr:unnamed protein product [Cyprideis torosa]CAG0884905.1 unnamed protein product [Cyprideis torosa]